MKLDTKIGTLALLTIGLSFGSCTNVKKSAKKFDEGTKMTSEPEVLELRGDSVEYEMTIKVDPKAMNKKAAVEVNPVLVYGDKSTPRPQISLEGTKARDGEKQNVITSDGATITYKDKFKYEPEMRNSTLKANPEMIIKGYDQVQDQCYKLDGRVIAKGIVTTQLLAKNGEDVLESGDKYEPIFKNVDIELYYLINNASFNPSFKVKSAKIDNKSQINKMKDLSRDSQYVVKGIAIDGYASPDGELIRNKDLSKKRAENTFKYLTKELKKLGFSEVNDSAYYLQQSLSEDWAGWKKLVQASDLADKDAILSIMNSSMGDDAKEAEIKKNHKKSYEKMKNDMLPLLRRSIVKFNRQQPLKTDQELLALGNNLDQLVEIELLQVARLYTNNEDKLRVYNHMVNKYPNDWRGYNNAAVIQLKNENATAALPLLDKANSLNPNNGIVLNNYGVAYAIQKDYKKAEEFYNKAKTANINVDKNIGVLYMKQGKYTEAIDKMNKNNCEFNVALSYTLKGDYDNAKKSLDCVKTEDKDAQYYYLYAVVGARVNNLEMVTTNLTRSIQLDSKMREMAKTDLEFRKVNDKVEFQNAVR